MCVAWTHPPPGCEGVGRRGRVAPGDMCRASTARLQGKCPRPRSRAGQAWPHRSVASLNAQLPAWPAPIVPAQTEDGQMQAIGIDTHKATLAACAIDELGIAARRAGRSPTTRRATRPCSAGCDEAPRSAASASRARRASGRPRPGSCSPRARTSARCRRSSVTASGCARGGPARAIPGDALAIARVTLREPDLPPVRLADATARSGSSSRPARISSPRRPGSATGSMPTSSSSSRDTGPRPPTSSLPVNRRTAGRLLRGRARGPGRARP